MKIVSFVNLTIIKVIQKFLLHRYLHDVHSFNLYLKFIQKTVHKYKNLLVINTWRAYLVNGNNIMANISYIPQLSLYNNLLKRNN